MRLPAYPKIDYNTGGDPACSPCPYPVGTGPAASCTPTSPLSSADYVTKVLKPAVDYAASKHLYAIIDFHQIDNVTTGTSLQDAVTFWTDVAPKFAGYPNVLFEPFNEPIDYSVPWSTLKPAVQQLVDAIRTGAPKNLIIVPSNAWDQHPGDAASDPPSSPGRRRRACRRETGEAARRHPPAVAGSAPGGRRPRRRAASSGT